METSHTGRLGALVAAVARTARGLGRWRGPLVAAGALLLTLGVLAGGSVSLAARPESCLTCHEMQPHFEQWRVSTHKEVVCVDCHTEPGVLGLVKIEASMLKNTAGHLTGTYQLPIRADVRDDSCLRCHTRESRPEVMFESSLRIAHSQHEGVACADCHGRLVHTVGQEPIPQPLTHKEGTKACQVCHTPENSPHGPSRVDCASCHSADIPGHALSEKTNVPPRQGCIDCHNAASVAPQESCQTCHISPHGIDRACNKCHTSVDTWEEKTLVHRFPLDGGHSDVTCTQCHKTGTQLPVPGAEVVWPVGEPAPSNASQPAPAATCSSCHQPKHQPYGDNDCATCHSVNGWKPSNAAAFDHGILWANYVGAHAKASCDSCHQTAVRPGVTPTCNTCHQPPDQHFGSDCSLCHNPTTPFKRS